MQATDVVAGREDAVGRTLDVRLPAEPVPADVASLCAALASQLHLTAVDCVECDARALPGDVGSVELLARLALIARRSGARWRLRGVSDELAPLLVLVGLDGVLSLGEAR